MKNLFKVFFKFGMLLMRIFPVKNNKIVFSSFSARSYSDNPKYIAEELLKMKKNLDLVVILRKDAENDVPKDIRVVKYNTLRYMYEMATAYIWVDNTRKQPQVLKRKKQYYIQTWHGSLALKKIEKDAFEKLDKEYVLTAINDSKNIDLMISNSKFSDELFRQSFWYKGDIAKYGSPRNDILFNMTEQQKNIIRNELGVKQEEYLVLYAPTFRISSDFNPLEINFDKLIDTITKKEKRKVKLLLRLHPNLSDSFNNIEGTNNIINVTRYPDVYKLMAISDVLITDYSSLMFEFPLIENKTTFLFAPDIVQYVDERGFYFDFNNLPFPLAENLDNLCQIIDDFNYIEYKKNLQNFYNSLEVLEDGKASLRVAEHICKLIDVK